MKTKYDGMTESEIADYMAEVYDLDMVTLIKFQKRTFFKTKNHMFEVEVRYCQRREGFNR